jgi:hypothetical protein
VGTPGVAEETLLTTHNIEHGGRARVGRSRRQGRLWKIEVKRDCSAIREVKAHVLVYMEKKVVGEIIM